NPHRRPHGEGGESPREMGGPPRRGDERRHPGRPRGLRPRNRHGFLHPHRCGGPPTVVGGLRPRGSEEPRGHGSPGFGQHRHQRARPGASDARSARRHVQWNYRRLSMIIIIIYDIIQWEALTIPCRYPGEGFLLPFEIVIVSNTPLTPLKDIDDVSLLFLTQIGYIPKGYDPKTDASSVRDSVPYRLFVECLLGRMDKGWTVEQL